MNMNDLSKLREHLEETIWSYEHLINKQREFIAEAGLEDKFYHYLHDKDVLFDIDRYFKPGDVITETKEHKLFFKSKQGTHIIVVCGKSEFEISLFTVNSKDDLIKQCKKEALKHVPDKSYKKKNKKGKKNILE